MYHTLWHDQQHIILTWSSYLNKNESKLQEILSMHLDLQLYYAPSIFVFPQTIFFS